MTVCTEPNLDETESYVVISSSRKTLKSHMESNIPPDLPSAPVLVPTIARPTRYAVKFDPPTFCLEYQDIHEKKRVRAVRLIITSMLDCW